jgi:hypothetical protein
MDHSWRAITLPCLAVDLLLVVSAACGPTGTEPPSPTDTPLPPPPSDTPIPPPPEPTATTKPTDTPIAPTPEPSATPTTAAAAPELPTTPSTAVIGDGPLMTYKIDMATFEELEFDESELPVPPGTVEAHWYTSGGRYVVAFVGLDLSASGPLCPGASILTDQGYEFVSNAPTEEGACEGFTTLTADPEVGPRVCQGTVLYVTAIPSDKQGILFASIEANADDGAAVIGLTSEAESSPDIPEIDQDDFCT